jgi:hypothetical protein
MRSMEVNEAHLDNIESTEPAVDPQRVFESITSELESLLQDAAPGVGSNLIELHAALLVFALEGQSSLIPAATFGFSVRRTRERRLLRSARRIALEGRHDAATSLRIAADVIERHLALIDPELASFAA